MNKLQFKPVGLMIISVLIAIVILLIEVFITGSKDGSFLLTLSFWITLVQGTVAVAAAADVSQGKWAEPLKKELFAFYPLILFTAVIFLILGFHMDIYKWTAKPGRWLNPSFFILRNFFLILLTFILAHFYIRASLKGSKSKGVLAVLYIFAFVAIQSFVAFDWIMTLEFPWMSTMFGPIFFMESFYAGLALGGIIAAYFIVRKIGETGAITKVLRDMATFMFGFALAWAGLYYGQFLVIWYGNIPWETSYFGIRMNHGPFNILLYLIIFILFIIPFVTFIPKKIKVSPAWVSFISVLVLIGILLERIFYILPVVQVNVVAVVIEFVLIGLLMVLFFLNREQIIKTSV
jgi:hypothetical protein